MTEMEQPTSARIQGLLPLVKDELEREILFRLQSNLNAGARCNDNDIARYNAMWFQHQVEAEKNIEIERKRKEVEKAKAEQAIKDAAPKPTPPTPTLPGAKPSPGTPLKP